MPPGGAAQTELDTELILRELIEFGKERQQSTSREKDECVLRCEATTFISKQGRLHGGSGTWARL